MRDPHKTPATDLVIELTTVNGRIVLGGAAGTIQLLIDATDTKALDPQLKSRYDLELEDASGTVTRLVQGTVKVSENITT